MLFKNSVEPTTLSLLEELMQIPDLNNFELVGGTALALKFGHRKSVDLDLFSTDDFEIDEIISLLSLRFKNNFRFEKTNVNWAVFCYIQNVKVDFVKYPHPKLKQTEFVEAIRLYSTEDIAAMKVNAILGRAAKKDFFDLVILLEQFQLKEIISFYKNKYPDQMLLISIPNALTYFADAETDVDPIALNGQTWEVVKKTLQAKVREYLS